MERHRIVAVSVILALAGMMLWGLGVFDRTVPKGYTVIDLTADDGERRLLAALLRDGERVTLRWRNSQFGLDVTEGFFADSGRLVQDRVTFALPGGPPSPPVSPADVADLFHTGGPFDARGLARPFSRIVYRISEIGDPRLEVQGRTVFFKREVGFGGRVVLAARRPALHEIAFGR